MVDEFRTFEGRVWVKYGSIPDHCRESLRAYVEHGRPVGSFLHAILANNLVGAFSYADDENAARIKDYAEWLWNEAPGDSWGSDETYRAWLERGGLQGKSEKES